MISLVNYQFDKWLMAGNAFHYQRFLLLNHLYHHLSYWNMSSFVFSYNWKKKLKSLNLCKIDFEISILRTARLRHTSILFYHNSFTFPLLNGEKFNSCLKIIMKALCFSQPHKLQGKNMQIHSVSYFLPLLSLLLLS